MTTTVENGRIRYDHFIDGESVAPSGGEHFESFDPYLGEAWAEIARGNSADVDRAVAAAQRAGEEWGRMKPHSRGLLLYRLADVLEENADHLARTEVRDNGKLYAEMYGQCKSIAGWYRYFGGLADKVEGALIPTDKENILNYTKYEPVGTVAMITPWNSPLLLLSWKLAAALAAGNTAVIKPSEFTSASTIEFAKLVSQAGIPQGVVNVVTGFGSEVGAPLVEHDGVSMVAFTGSEAAGRAINEAAARSFKRVTLELGGKSPNIVFADADIDSAVPGVISGIFAATGQTCLAGSRLLVQRAIHDEFVDALVAMASEAKIGNPMDAETNIGPVTTRPQYEKVLKYIDIAREEGATTVLGGSASNAPGTQGGQFVEPTIFTGVTNDMRIAREEVFGPVLSVIPFEDEEDAIRIANDSLYGLAAGVWTADIGRAVRMSDQIQAGTVWVNTYRAVSFTSPFGGYKNSGVGRESGQESIKEFLQTKSVWISTEANTSNPFVLK